MRYFIIDDDQIYCLRLQEMLDEAKAESVSFANTIDEALAFIHDAARAETLPDVILCDYNLGDFANGFQFLSALQNEGFDIPAVLLTDYDDEAIIERALKQYSAVHIAKTGLESAELIQQISIFAFRRWAEQRRLASQQIRRQASNILLVGAEIAHEFKEVIRATRMQLHRMRRAMERGTLSPVLYDRLAAQLEAVLEDGVQLSSILMKYGGEIQGHELKLEPADVPSEVEMVAAQPEFAELNVSIKLDAGFDAALIDRFVVRRALSVLFRNILDHAAGGFDVAVTIGETLREGARALFIDVEDNGPGIPADHRRKVFEAGERAGKNIQYAGGGGLGLGLGFAKTLVGLHASGDSHGTIHCLPGTSGTGARFRISIPQE